MTLEKAIDLLETYDFDDSPEMTQAAYMGTAALRAQMEAENEPLAGWISVKDRLPDAEGTCIVGSVKTGRVGARYFYKPFPDAFILNDEITHWIPLPEPPKEENV